MKFTVERDAMAGALAIVNARSLGKGMSIPILECVLLDAAESRLRVFAHWLDACCSFEIPAEIAMPGRIALDAEKLTGLIGGFAKGAQVSVSVSVSVSGVMAEIKAGRARYRLPGMPTEDYPVALTDDDAVTFSVPAADFLALLGTPEIAMSSEITRYYLCGTYLHATKDGLASCATDGSNLIRVQTTIKAPQFAPIIIPRTRIGDLQTGVGKDDVQIECSPRLLSVIVGARRYTTKLVDGMFPDYTRVMPPRAEHAIIVTRDDFLSALQRLRVLLGDRSTIVMKWEAGAPTLVLSPYPHEDAADETIESDGGQIAAGQFQTAAPRLAALMSVMPYDEVKITFTDGSSPLRIEGVNDDRVLQLIMPTDFGRPAAKAA